MRQLVLIVSIAAVGSFVWWYPSPLNADFALHIAGAKAFLDLISGKGGENYPYVLHVKLASYALPVIILALFIKLAGLTLGAKLALTLYALALAHAVWFLVGQVNPQSRWTRLIGFAVALGYMFHWGFWPAMLGTITAVYAIGLTLKYEGTSRFFPVGTGMRLLTFLMHPAPTLALGLFDTIYVLVRLPENRQWLNPLTWKWRTTLYLWLPSVVAAAWMYLSFTNPQAQSTFLRWGSIRLQLFELVRSVYVTDNLLEFAFPLLLGLALIIFAAIRTYRDPRFLKMLVAALCLCLTGMAIPVVSFLGKGGRIGCRISFLGLILLFSLVSAIEAKARRAVAIWVVSAIIINVGISHVIWHKHSASFEKAVSTLRENFQGIRINGQVLPNARILSIPVGGSVGIWAWCHGYVGDAYNGVMHFLDFGPVKYVGLDSTAPNEGPGLILYHPYLPTDAVEQSAYSERYGLMDYSQTFMLDDSIYTIYLR
jgi:hypothetical protein